MLVAFASLRVFTLELRDNQLHGSFGFESYRRYITKVSRQAPHLESLTIDCIYYDTRYTFRCEQVNANWVVCEEPDLESMFASFRRVACCS
jgi:hypothetical protein